MASGWRVNFEPQGVGAVGADVDLFVRKIKEVQGGTVPEEVPEVHVVAVHQSNATGAGEVFQSGSRVCQFGYACYRPRIIVS